MDPRRTIRRGLALTTIAGLAGALLATPAAGGERAGGEGLGGPVEPPAWAACPDDLVTPVPLECATVQVPLDYDEPGGRQIEVVISRLASTDPGKREGVLLLNPGGPGGSGLAQPAEMANLGMPDSVLDRYDLIGMDPRGVGKSSPVTCGFTADQPYMGNIPPYAPDAEAVAEHAEVARQVAAQCAEHDTDGRMQHMTTANTARDIDRIRELLGEEKLSFYGASYGSALGSAFATLFPDTSDRVIVDSNLGATSLDRDSHRRFGLGMEKRFPDFARWVAARHDTYELGRTPAQVRAGFLELAAQLDKAPVAGVDGALFRAVGFGALYTEARFGITAQLWQGLTDSDESAVRARLRDLEDVQPEVGGLPAVTSARGATSKPSPYDNAWSSYLAVTCNDTDWPEDMATYQRDTAVDRKRYPLFGGAGANITPCAFWHNDPVDPELEISDEGPGNVLVLQNLRDPATPHAGGVLARERFGDRARLVSVDAGEHGVYVYDDNACALNTTTRFLLTGELPRTDVFCPA